MCEQAEYRGNPAVHPEFTPTFVGSHVVSGAWLGVVASVHKLAINVERSDGFLVSVVSSKQSMTSYSLLTLCTEDLDSMVQRVRRGMPVSCTNEILRFPTFRIRLKDVPLYAGTVRIVDRARIPPSRLLKTLDELRDSLRRSARDESLLGALLPEGPANAFCLQARRILYNQSQNTAIDLRHLVGMGIGSTPSGDDFITGALLAERFLRLAHARLQRGVPNRRLRLRGVGRAHGMAPHEGGPPVIRREPIRRMLFRTTAAGRTLLLAALHGSFPGYLTNLLAGFVSDKNGSLAAAVDAAARQGATSGSDAATGFLWYLQMGVPHGRAMSFVEAQQLRRCRQRR